MGVEVQTKELIFPDNPSPLRFARESHDTVRV